MKTVLRKNHVNRESDRLELTIQLYICYDEHEDPSSCNTTVYLSQTFPEHIDWNGDKEPILNGPDTSTLPAYSSFLSLQVFYVFLTQLMHWKNIHVRFGFLVCSWTVN